MSATPIELIRRSLPLKVLGLEVGDPVLTVFGDDWSLSLVCPWTLDGPGLFTSWEAEDIERAANTLVGRRLEDVSARDSDATDPVFRFSGGLRLKVLADTDLDPWAMMVPGHVVIGRQAR